MSATQQDPPHRKLEWEIEALEDRLRTKYGGGIGATYVCTKCWRRSSAHLPTKNVKGCKHPRISFEQYTAELDAQIVDLKKVLNDNETIASLRDQITSVTAESTQREKDKLRLERSIFSFGTYVSEVRAVSRDLMSIVAKREAAEISEDEFLASLSGVAERQKGLDFRKGLSHAEEEGAEGGDDVEESDSNDEEEDAASSIAKEIYTWDAFLPDAENQGGREPPPPPPPAEPPLPPFHPRPRRQRSYPPTRRCR